MIFKAGRNPAPKADQTYRSFGIIVLRLSGALG